MYTAIDAQILVAECERIIALDLCIMLARLGYKSVESAYSVEEAFQKLNQRKPDVLIIDEMIDGVSGGNEFGRAVMEKYKIPVMLLSDTVHMGHRAARSGKFRVVTKPFGEREIDRSLRSILLKKTACS